MKFLRTQYVATLWSRASTPVPGDSLCPTNHGWAVRDGILVPVWYDGPAIPDKLFGHGRDDVEGLEPDTSDDKDEQDNIGVNPVISDYELWSEDSDSEQGDKDYSD